MPHELGQPSATHACIIQSESSATLAPPRAAHSAGLVRDIPGARLATLPDGGHLVPHIHPNAYLALLHDFLAAEPSS